MTTGTKNTWRNRDGKTEFQTEWMRPSHRSRAAVNGKPGSELSGDFAFRSRNNRTQHSIVDAV